MSGGFMTFDLSGFPGLPNSIRIAYNNYWNTFEAVQATNITVSTLRSQGDLTKTYYTYSGNKEQVAFTNGRFLHIQRYPNSNWAEVSKD
jgi:hypothetical protein